MGIGRVAVDGLEDEEGHYEVADDVADLDVVMAYLLGCARLRGVGIRLLTMKSRDIPRMVKVNSRAFWGGSVGLSWKSPWALASSGSFLAV